MTKTIFIVSFFLLLVSCHHTADRSQKEEQSVTVETFRVEPPTEESTDDLPPEALLFDAVAELTKFQAADEAKLNKALDIIKTVIKSKEFRDQVLNFSYHKNKSFIDNGGLSNAQVYQKILDGSETLKPGVDHRMDLDLELYRSSSNTVGYTYPSEVRIWMNTKYFDKYTPSEVAGNIFHEWTHKIGFKHSSRYNSRRKYSVPYALGYIMRDLGKKYE